MTQYDKKIKSFRPRQGDGFEFYAERRLANKSQRHVDAVKDLQGVRLELHGCALCVFTKPGVHNATLKSLNFKWDYRNRRWYKAMTFTGV